MELVAARRDIGGMSGEQRDRMDQTVAAEELAEGQWFWNERNPLQSRAVQAAAVQAHDRGVRVVTTDESHEVLSYTRGRRIRLGP